MTEKKSQQKQNVIMFPGMIDRLKSQAHTYAETYQYDLAVETFEEVLRYEEGEEQMLSAYAFSLFEIRRFADTRAVCEQLFQMGTDLYIEVMELYLSTCMELREFQHVEEIISQLMAENVIPPQAMEQFEHIRALNERIAETAAQKEQKAYVEEMIQSEDYLLDAFFEQSLWKQMQLLRTLQQANVRPLAPKFKKIIEAEDVHPMIQSVALYILVEQEISIEVKVTKFGHSQQFNAQKLVLPEQMDIVNQVMSITEETLQQEVSVYDMVQYLVARHILVTYPYAWFDYEAQDVAEGYVDYVHQMFGHVQETDYDLMNFFTELEKFSELPEA